VGSSEMCTDSDAVSSRYDFGDVCLYCYTCVVSVHCILLEWNFTFRNAGENVRYLCSKTVMVRAGDGYAQVVCWDSASLLLVVVAPLVFV
jgi:hypothetical protein